MIELSITKNFNLKNIKFDFSKELNEGIDVVATDIEKGIQKGIQFGKPFKRNAEKTIKRKGFDHPLKDTGLMMNPNQMIKGKASINRQISTLLPNEDRIDIGYWNDRGTDRIPRRHFWGISKNAEKIIMTKMAARMDQELRKA